MTHVLPRRRHGLELLSHHLHVYLEEGKAIDYDFERMRRDLTGRRNNGKGKRKQKMRWVK